MSDQMMNGKDDGITLIELIVAMGIFSLLLILTSIFMISGVRSIRDTTGRNSVQQEQQNASEWISRLIRYADNPYANSPVVPSFDYAGTVAGQPVVTFYTFAGAGKVDRVPYKVTLTKTAKGIVTSTWAPDMTTGRPVYTASVNNGCRTAPVDSTCSTRLVVPVSKTNTPTLSMKYYKAGTPTTGIPSPPMVELIPPVNGTLTAAQIATLRAVEFTIGGTSASQSVAQKVVLANGQS
jgi:type II secretory pathway pseudopilin PulG